jgi:lipopolysaccharide/colanic/teichoic acid biosynthesis glycosyltransferase
MQAVRPHNQQTGQAGGPVRRRSLRPPGRVFEAGKRALDVVAALLGLVVLSPLMLFCAAWIKLVDGGPVMYKQWRVGRDGWLFNIYKFRTMGLDAERQGVRFATDGDPRILPGCKWVRKCHADELPQLVNILRGQMSLVGPRPERPEIIEQLRDDMPGIERRLEAAPGLTGLAQVRNGYSNDLAGMRRKLAFDLRYLRSRSLTRDMTLILETIPRVWDPTAC